MALQTSRVSIRKGTAAEQQAGAVLALGQFGIASDTGVVKVGDGATAWNSLRSLNGTTEALQDEINGIIVAGAGITKVYDDAGAGTITLSLT